MDYSKKHTPGSWAAWELSTGCYDITAAEQPGHPSVDKYDPSLAWVQENTHYPHTKGNAYRNASLIIAAPEMLEALQMVLEGHEDGESLERALPFVKAAIANAKGEV